VAKPLLPDELWEIVEPLVPPAPPKPKGGRPRVPDRACLTAIVFVLRSGIPWEMLPRELGCGSGVTSWRRLRDWQTDGVWDRIYPALLDRLGEADKIDWSRAALDAASVPAKRGRGGGTEPDRSRQRRHQASPRHRSAGDAAGGPPDRGQPPRVDGVRRAARRHPADQAPLRAAAPAPGQAPRRQGVRCPPLPPGALLPTDQGPDRPQGDRAQGAVGPPPLGGRAHAGVAQPLPPFDDPLRTR